MKILFSPSEAKKKGGESGKIDRDSFIFPNLFEKRMEALTAYHAYISSAKKDELAKLFGTQKEELIEYYRSNLLEKESASFLQNPLSEDVRVKRQLRKAKPEDKSSLRSESLRYGFEGNLVKAIGRYEGVAYEYLNYASLTQDEQNYIDSNVIIFSNLFGPLLAGDYGIPDYKLKQGEKIGDFVLENFYAEHFKKALDDYLEDEDIVDLRADFYQKFYKIDRPYLTMRFIKEGKTVSHWAKAYRGTVLREMAKNNINSTKEAMSMPIKNLALIEIKELKFKTEIVYEVCE